MDCIFKRRFESVYLFEYILEFYNIEDEEIDDLLCLMRFDNGYLFDKNNMPKCWFFPKENIKIKSSDINFQIDKLRHQLCYLPSPEHYLNIYLEYDPNYHKKNIIRFSDDFTKFTDKTDTIIKKFNNIYKNYYIIKSNNTKLSIKMENVFDNPYKYSENDEKDLTKIYFFDAYRPIKKIYLHILNQPSNKLINETQTELYRDNIDRSLVKNSMCYSSNHLVKFGGKHIKYNLPESNKNYLYELMDISNKDIEKYNNIIKDDEKSIESNFVSFCIIGQNNKSPIYLSEALYNLRKNLKQYQFNNYAFIESVINKIIYSINNYTKNNNL